MRRISFRWMAALVIGAALMSGSAFAQGRGHGHAAAPVWRNGAANDRGYSDWRGDGDRWSFGRQADQRPPGWDKGKKTGWGNCDVPPGQAKKQGCSNGWFGSRRDRRGDVLRRNRRDQRNRAQTRRSPRVDRDRRYRDRD